MNNDAKLHMPAVVDGLTVTDVDGELLVLDQANGLVHQLNPSASFVFSHCDGQSERRQVQQQMCETFQIDVAVAERDLQATLELLASQNLLR